MSFNKLSDAPQSGAIESLDERSIIGQDERELRLCPLRTLIYASEY